MELKPGEPIPSGFLQKQNWRVERTWVGERNWEGPMQPDYEMADTGEEAIQNAKEYDIYYRDIAWEKHHISYHAVKISPEEAYANFEWKNPFRMRNADGSDMFEEVDICTCSSCQEAIPLL